MILFRAGFLQGTNIEAFDGVDHLGPLPGKHQLDVPSVSLVTDERFFTYQVRVGGGTSGVR